MIVGFCGVAGSGKDTGSDFFVKAAPFTKVAFADPLKRICKDVYKFSDEQLWGPSTMRNTPDTRYVHRYFPADPSGFDQDAPRTEYLTPRHALQQLGTEWGRNCYPDTWIDYAFYIYEQMKTGRFSYSMKRGLEGRDQTEAVGNEHWHPSPRNVVISDVRFPNEIYALKKKGAVLIRLQRGEQLEGDAGKHLSETALADVPLDAFDFIFDNREWSLVEYEAQCRGLIATSFKGMVLT